jgi:alpha-amylase/alpha-mannosidase (GH57 family)
MDRYICVHGHFYQPPRDNAWLEYVELQDAAYPFHDWNERITAECYEPNSSSHILDSERQIVHIVNNYARISFNFGPTLLSWMEQNAPQVYEAVLAADRESQKTFSGHGSAQAQAYNHMILPLANRRDKYTQMLWGIRDFDHRFGRKPEGMWLPETAVDLETLNIMAELGLRFTVLAPHQARRVRPIGGRVWRDVSGGQIDPTMAYQVRLASGRSLSVLFYHEPTARAVAFEGLLTSGEDFASRLVSVFSETPKWPQLVHIATDGETYGHHHRFGDMALAYALHHIEANNLARITNYPEYLDRHPPTYEVEIVENTSWSCVHGVERWRSDCGCHAGTKPGWNQSWRAPLRQALDWLRDTVAPKYEETARHFLKDPWAARNDYIGVVLDRSPESVQRFMGRHAARELSQSERTTALKLLELQRYAMLMYTSCGWFFDELTRIETVQIMHYAGRVVQLAEELFAEPIEPGFLDLLGAAKSNIPRHGDGRSVYERFVKPAMVDLTKVAAHYAISSLFEEYGEQARIFCYDVDVGDYHSHQAGRASLALGRAAFTSEITSESASLSFGVLHFGDHNLNAGVRAYLGEEPYQAMLQEVTQSFSGGYLPQVIRLLDKHFGTSTYSLRSLFRDEQRKVVNRILESTTEEVEAAFRQVYDHHYSLMRFLADLGTPPSKAFHAAASFILNTDLRKQVDSDAPDVERIGNLLDEAKVWNAELDAEGLSYLLGKTLERLMAGFVSNPGEASLLRNLVATVKLARSMPHPVDLWRVQNLFYDMLSSSYPAFQAKAREGEEEAAGWVSQFLSLGEQLSVRIP